MYSSKNIEAAIRTVRTQKELPFAVVEVLPQALGTDELELKLIAALENLDDALALAERWSQGGGFEGKLIGVQQTTPGGYRQTDFYENGVHVIVASRIGREPLEFIELATR